MGPELNKFENHCCDLVPPPDYKKHKGLVPKTTIE
jgi:hypothetical protein